MIPQFQELLFERQYANELLQISAGDLETAEALGELGKGRKENVCLFAHESIGKALRAVLVWNEVAFPLVHDVGILVAKMPKGLVPPSGYDLSVLNSYATVRRYEQGKSILTPQAIDSVLATAKAVLAWATALCR